MGAVLRVLEVSAASGVLVTLKNCRGRDVELNLMPRLLCINIDQPEAQLYYGMRNRQSCSKCKRREGYSAFRQGSPQNGDTIRRLYALANGPDGYHQEVARWRLRSYGFNPDRECLLSVVADKLLVRVPRIPRTVELFPSVDFRDKMHGMFIFFQRVLMEGLTNVMWKSRPGLRMKELLDDRLTLVETQGTFRTNEARACRVQKSLFSNTNMSAVDKVCVVFMMPHVFGHQGIEIPENVRVALMTAIARAQLMLIAASGRREYTRAEAHQIFDEGYTEMFASLEHIYQIKCDCSYAKQMRLHTRQPDVHPPPKRFKSQRQVYSTQTFISSARTCIKIRTDFHTHPYGRLLKSARIFIHIRTDFNYIRPDVAHTQAFRVSFWSWY